MGRPRLSEEFVEAHDGAVWQCFCQLVGIAGDSDEARRAAGVPMNLGGLGLCLAALHSGEGFRHVSSGAKDFSEGPVEF